MKYVLVMSSLLLNLVYALSNNEPIVTNHAKLVAFPHLVYYFYNTFQNPNFWKINYALKLYNTQMWGLNGGEEYDC
jgi:hypothetical protein